MSDFSFISQLSESKLIPSRGSLKQYEPEQLVELAFLYIISLRILLAEQETRPWAEQYCRRSTRGGNFRQWRSDGTDLYVLLHVLTNRSTTDDTQAEYFQDHLGLQPMVFYRWISKSISYVDEADTKRFFSKLDNTFKIRGGSLRAVRRLAQDWPNLDNHERKLAMTRLLQFMRSRARKGDFLPQLEHLSRHLNLELHGVCNLEDDSVHFDHHPTKAKTGSFLKTLLPLSIGAGIGYSLMRKENATMGGTSASNVATAVGGIGAGFDNDYSKSVYPAPVKAIIRRTSITGNKTKDKK